MISAIVSLSLTATAGVAQQGTSHQELLQSAQVMRQSLSLQRSVDLQQAQTHWQTASMQRALAQQQVLDMQRTSQVLQGRLALGATPVTPASFELFPADSADELFRRARTELRRRNYDTALALFRQLQEEFPNSSYMGQAVYYEAWTLNRMGGESERRRAVDLLTGLGERHPDVAEEAASLRMQILGRLGRQGDPDASAQVALVAAQAAQMDRQRAAAEAARARSGSTPVIAGQAGQESEDVKMQALNALMQMDAEAAMPILRRVLENREADNVPLRRRAVFLVAQKRGADREEILLDVARNDPDGQVREQAVFHLAQVRTDAAVDALDSILQYSPEERLQERAIFALAQHRSERAGEILQAYVRRTNAPADLRASAIQWLGQRRNSGPFLQDLYGELTDETLKDRVLFALSQRRSPENAAFLMSIATDETEAIDVRKQALFWVGQMRMSDDQLYQMYDQVDNREMKEQLLFVYGQRRDSLAVNQLIRIARDGSDAEMQGKAIFWLGQSRDPRAIAVLEEIINREEDR